MRRAHTMMEVLVVITLLSLMAAVAVPRLLAGLSRSRLDAALDAVRSDLSFARARATATGLRHQVSLDVRSGELRVQPFRPEELAAAGAPQAEPEPVLVRRLPEEVSVTSWSVSPLGYAAAAGAPTMTEILTLYPEGTSDGALLVLQDEGGLRRGLELDGFTGEIRQVGGEELNQR